MDSQKKSSLCGQEAVGRPSVRSDSFQSVSDILMFLALFKFKLHLSLLAP